MNNKKVGLPALFWLEYFTEKRSCSKDSSNNAEFCKQFVERKCYAYYCNFHDLDENNFFT